MLILILLPLIIITVWRDRCQLSIPHHIDVRHRLSPTLGTDFTDSEADHFMINLLVCFCSSFYHIVYAVSWLICRRKPAFGCTKLPYICLSIYFFRYAQAAPSPAWIGRDVTGSISSRISARASRAAKSVRNSTRVEGQVPRPRALYGPRNRPNTALSLAHTLEPSSRHYDLTLQQIAWSRWGVNGRQDGQRS